MRKTMWKRNPGIHNSPSSRSTFRQTEFHCGHALMSLKTCHTLSSGASISICSVSVRSNIQHRCPGNFVARGLRARSLVLQADGRITCLQYRHRRSHWVGEGLVATPLAACLRMPGLYAPGSGEGPARGSDLRLIDTFRRCETSFGWSHPQKLVQRSCESSGIIRRGEGGVHEDVPVQS